jgi:hypothetical protein
MAAHAELHCQDPCSPDGIETNACLAISPLWSMLLIAAAGAVEGGSYGGVAVATVEHHNMPCTAVPAAVVAMLLLQ